MIQNKKKYKHINYMCCPCVSRAKGKIELGEGPDAVVELSFQIRVSIVVSIRACHVRDRGSIPRLGVPF